MTDNVTGWRAIPIAFKAAFVFWFAGIALRLITLVAGDPFSQRAMLAGEGIVFAAITLALLGALELTSRLTGREALGARIAAGGAAGSVFVHVFFTALLLPTAVTWTRDVWLWSLFASYIAIVGGYAFAVWPRARGLAVAAVAIALLAMPPPVWRGSVLELVGLSGKPLYVANDLLRAARFVLIIAMLARLSPVSSITDRAAAAAGLRAISHSLWLRVIAALAVPFFTLMLMDSRSNDAVRTLQMVTVLAGGINVIALSVFGIGAMRAARASVPELDRLTLVLAAAASLWAAGVTFSQLPFTYRMLSGELEYLRSYLGLFVIVAPVVVAIAMILLGIAIGGMASHTNNEELRAQAHGKTAGYITLSFVGLLVQLWMLPKATTVSAAAALMLCAAAATLIATGIMARLATMAAEEIEREPGLPAAKVVSGPA